jgi:glycine oxidase
MLRVGIAGAGLLGRLLAWQLSLAGAKVSVFDPAPAPAACFGSQRPAGQPVQAAGFTAAGMLSPLAELDHASPATAALGWRSIALWRQFAAQLPGAPWFSERGSLLLAHPSELASAQRALARIQHAMRSPDWHAPAGCTPQAIAPATLQTLEPALQGPLHAWMLPQEAQIDTVATMDSLWAGAPDVAWHWGCPVSRVEAGLLHTGAGAQRYDVAIDTRGVGGAGPMAVRGVRGEMLWLHAPGLALQRPVRLLHPRHRVYIVPRPNDTVLVGASEIESDDCSPVSVRSTLELLAAAHSVLPGLAEARIMHMDSNVRPALPDNNPSIQASEGLLRINGLFRHGWLLAPALVEQALAQMPQLSPLPQLPQLSPLRQPLNDLATTAATTTT